MLNVKDAEVTQLYNAIQDGNMLKVALMLQGKTKKHINAYLYSSSSSTMLSVALRKKDAGMTELILGAGADPCKPVEDITKSSKRLYPIELSSTCLESTQMLLNAGAIPTFRALEYAIEDNSDDVVDALISDPKFDLPYIFGKDGKRLCRLMCWMLQKGMEHHVLKMFELGLDRKSLRHKGLVLLRTACDKNKLDVVKYLVESGVNINGKDSSKRTLLMIATGKENLEIVKYLCAMGADPTCVDKHDCSAISYTYVTEIKDIISAHSEKWKEDRKWKFRHILKTKFHF